MDQAEGGKSAELGTRERNRIARKQQLLKAAYALLLDAKGTETFSMPALAEKAGVSLATPYNLFGSKAAILLGVFLQETDKLQRRTVDVEAASVSARIAKLADHLASVFNAKPVFYRNLYRHLSALDSEDVRKLILPVSEAVLAPFVRDLKLSGELEEAVPETTVASHLTRIFESIFLHWVAEDWTAARLRQEIRRGMSLGVLGVVTIETRKNLISEIAAACPPD